MDRDSVIERIRQRMAAGALPRVIPPLTAPGKPTSPTGHIKFDTSIGIVTCAACDTHGAQVAYRFPDGRIGEIFLNNHKSNSAADTNARDSAIVCSIALQYGADPETIRRALCRDSQGRASGPLGAALDRIADREGA